MTLYNVHLYREMRLTFERIEAPTPVEAAATARELDTADADEITSCDGETLAALVDVVGDDQYEQSVTIDFEPERLRKAVPELLEALEDLLGDLPTVQGGVCHHCGREYGDIPSGDCPSDDCPSFKARAALAKATTIHHSTIERKLP